jgi:hypothetical protein
MILDGDIGEEDNVLLYLDKNEEGKDIPKIKKMLIADQVEELVNMRTFRKNLVTEMKK